MTIVINKDSSPYGLFEERKVICPGCGSDLTITELIDFGGPERLIRGALCIFFNCPCCHSHQPFSGLNKAERKLRANKAYGHENITMANYDSMQLKTQLF